MSIPVTNPVFGIPSSRLLGQYRRAARVVHPANKQFNLGTANTPGSTVYMRPKAKYGDTVLVGGPLKTKRGTLRPAELAKHELAHLYHSDRGSPQVMRAERLRKALTTSRSRDKTSRNALQLRSVMRVEGEANTRFMQRGDVSPKNRVGKMSGEIHPGRTAWAKRQMSHAMRNSYDILKGGMTMPERAGAITRYKNYRRALRDNPMTAHLKLSTDKCWNNLMEATLEDMLARAQGTSTYKPVGRFAQALWKLRNNIRDNPYIQRALKRPYKPVKGN